MKLKIKITQKLLTRILILVIVLFVTVVVLRLFFNFVPPLIISVTTEDDHNNNNYKASIHGINFGKSQKHSKIIVNSKVLEKSDIITWKANKIRIVLDKKDLEYVIYIKTDQKTSNEKLVYIDQENMLLKDGMPYAQYHKYFEVSKLELMNTNITHPYEPLFFVGNEQVMKYSIDVNGKSYIIPKYYVFHNKLFLNENIWFDTSKETFSINLSTALEEYTFSITKNKIFNEFNFDTKNFELLLNYTERVGEYSYFVPIESSYQRRKLVGNISYTPSYSNSYFFSYNPQDFTMINIDTKFSTIQNINTILILPVKYNNDYLFDYLFESKPLELDDFSILSKEITKNPAISSIEIPSIYKTQNAVSEYFMLHTNLDKVNQPLDQDLLVYDNLMKDYVFLITSFVSGIAQDSLENMSFVNQLLLLTDYDRKQSLINLLVAKILRSQGMITRVMFGVKIFETNTEAGSALSLDYVSWIEVLSKNFGWLRIDLKNKNFYVGNDDSIALFIFERYISVLNKYQQPLIPKLSNVSVIQ